MKNDNSQPNFLKKVFKTKKRIIFFSILIAGGIIAYRYVSSRRENDIETARVYKGVVQEELILSGEIKAVEHTYLNFLTSGKLDQIGVAEGQIVKKDEVLARLDSTNAYQTYLQAEADLRRYDASLAKVYDDVQGHEKDESFAQIEARTLAETNRDKSYRAFVIAQQNLNNLILKAPFDGIVTSITHPYSGVNTSLTESQIEIINPDTIYFAVSADQTEVTRLTIGQKVNIVLDSFTDEELKGEIMYISYTPKLDEVGTVYEVNVRLLSEADVQKVRIGMSGDARFILTEKSDVLYVPPEFVNSDVSGKYINLGKRNNKVYIQLGIEGEDRVEISGNVTEGDVVYD